MKKQPTIITTDGKFKVRKNGRATLILSYDETTQETIKVTPIYEPRN